MNLSSLPNELKFIFFVCVACCNVLVVTRASSMRLNRLSDGTLVACRKHALRPRRVCGEVERSLHLLAYAACMCAHYCLKGYYFLK